MKYYYIIVLLLCLFITPVEASELIVDRVDNTEKMIAITVEDIENASEMEKTLKLCTTENIKITFFSPVCFLGSQAELVNQALKDGHEFGNYGVKPTIWEEFRHEDIIKEFKAADSILKGLGINSKVIKPVYYQYQDYIIDDIKSYNQDKIIVRGMNIPITKDTNTQFILEKLKTSVQSGDLINVNMQVPYEAAMLPEVIKELKNMGYRIVTVSELIASNKQ